MSLWRRRCHQFHPVAWSTNKRTFSGRDNRLESKNMDEFHRGPAARIKIRRDPAFDGSLLCIRHRPAALLV